MAQVNNQFSIASPINVFLQGDPLPGDCNGDHVHGGEVQILQLLDSLSQHSIIPRSGHVHTAQEDDVTRYKNVIEERKGRELSMNDHTVEPPIKSILYKGHL